MNRTHDEKMNTLNEMMGTTPIKNLTSEERRDMLNIQPLITTTVKEDSIITCPDNIELFIAEAINNPSDLVMTKDQWDHVAQCASCSAILQRIKEDYKNSK